MFENLSKYAIKQDQAYDLSIVNLINHVFITENPDPLDIEYIAALQNDFITGNSLKSLISRMINESREQSHGQIQIKRLFVNKHMLTKMLDEYGLENSVSVKIFGKEVVGLEIQPNLVLGIASGRYRILDFKELIFKGKLEV